MTGVNTSWLFEPPHETIAETQREPAAQVAFPRAPRGVFDYAIPTELRGKVSVGVPVRVPLGRAERIHIGYCVAVGQPTSTKRKLKSIVGLAETMPRLPEDLLRLGAWMVDYYVCDWSEVLQVLVPGALRKGTKSGGRPFARLTDAGREVVSNNQRPVDISATQWKILQYLCRYGPTLVRTLTKQVGCSTVPLSTLRKRGLIVIEKGDVPPEAAGQGRGEVVAPPAFTPEQAAAYRVIQQVLDRHSHEVVLVHGVTGSGKTELYLQAAAEVVRRGLQVIYLVPEISLTPQMTERLRTRFERVAIIHSHLSPRERRRQWEEVCSGMVAVVLGARSGVFAPAPNLGLIVVDEEHEWSFKQETAPRYHAREVAIARAQILGIPVILGSATPALETYAAALQGRCRVVTLRERVHGRPLPQVEVVDLRDPACRHGPRSIITPALHRAVDETLRAGGQVLLLLNRRGFAAAVICPVCGFVLRCPLCDIALTFHKTSDAAVCHYCGHTGLVPEGCPNCGAQAFYFLGFGTQRLEGELRRRFPQAQVARMDADAMRPRGAYEKTLAAFERGEVQILVGTQLIAKGLDFPNVGLVGIVYADLAIHFPDFRAGERTFQLLAQAAGRTGRGDRPGRVIIQTYCPGHPVIVAAARQAYEEFANNELAVRGKFDYPPFSQALRFVIRGKRQDRVRLTAERIGELIREGFPQEKHNYRLLGPAPCFLQRLHGRYRFHLLLLTGQAVLRQQIVRHVEANLKPPEGIIVVHDIDPLDML